MKTNKIMMQCFEWYLKADCTHWNRVADEASNLKDNGITAVWLPPAYKGAQGVNDVGYAVYDLYDLGEFDQKGTIPTKYGTKDEYLNAVNTLKNNGIEVLGDIVLGHKMGADEKERIFAYGHSENDRNVEIEGKRKITVWTKFTFPARNGKYSDFKWDWTNFHGTDYDAKSKENGIYRFIGKEWDSDVDNEFGNYDYLMGVDLDMSDPEVVEELQKWGKWYYQFTGVDGFRIDAVKHIDFNFFRNWLKVLRDEFKKPIFAVGEYWNAEIDILMNYIEKTESSLSLFDVPLHFNLFHASRSNGYYDMRYLLKNTLLSRRTDLSVTFVDNHDTQYGQSLESYVLEWFKQHAYSIILLRPEGYPCVFYGDFYGVPHDNLKPVKHLRTLMKLRTRAAYGKLHDYFNHPKIVGWTLEGDGEHENSGLAVLMTVECGGSKRMYIGKHFSGFKFVDALQNCSKSVLIDEDGFGEFYVNDGSVSVYRLKIEADKKVEYTDEEYIDKNEVSAYAEVVDITESKTEADVEDNSENNTENNTDYSDENFESVNETDINQ